MEKNRKWIKSVINRKSIKILPTFSLNKLEYLILNVRFEFIHNQLFKKKSISNLLVFISSIGSYSLFIFAFACYRLHF